MPRSYKNILRMPQPGLRISPGENTADPLREVLINGSFGKEVILGRGDILNLTITDSLEKIIHPTGFNADGSLVKAGLIDPYVADAEPFARFLRSRSSNSMGDIGIESGNPSEYYYGITPLGNVVLALGYKFTGGSGPAYVHNLEGIMMPGDCASAGLPGGRRSTGACSTHVTNSTFCRIFPHLCQCDVSTVFCNNHFYTGIDNSYSTESCGGGKLSGDVMFVELADGTRHFSGTTGANRAAQTGGSDVSAGPPTTTLPDTKGTSTGSFFTDTGLGYPESTNEASKAFVFNTGSGFAEDPSPRQVRLAITDVLNYDIVTREGDGAEDPGAPWFCAPGSTSYTVTLRAFAGQGNSFTAEPGVTRVGLPSRRSFPVSIGSGRRTASGVKGSVGYYGE